MDAESRKKPKLAKRALAFTPPQEHSGKINVTPPQDQSGKTKVIDLTEDDIRKLTKRALLFASFQEKSNKASIMNLRENDIHAVIDQVDAQVDAQLDVAAIREIMDLRGQLAEAKEQLFEANQALEAIANQANRLNPKYEDLVWFDRKTSEGVQTQERYSKIREKYPDYVEKLKTADDSDKQFCHGFNAGVLAAVRLFGELSVSTAEECYLSGLHEDAIFDRYVSTLEHEEDFVFEECEEYIQKRTPSLASMLATQRKQALEAFPDFNA